MAFGRIRKERRKKEGAQREQQQRALEYQDYKDRTSKLDAEEDAAMASQGTTADDKMRLAREQREAGEAAGRQRSNEVFNRDVSGISPQMRRQMQERANMSLNRNMQGYQRQLLASQGKRGLGGGAAYAQQADLARMGQDSQREAMADINQLDQSMAMKKLAAMIAMEQGEKALYANDWRQAQDELNLNRERQRDRLDRDRYNSYFARL